MVFIVLQCGMLAGWDCWTSRGSGGHREVEAMVPSWRYCMRGANARDIA